MKRRNVSTGLVGLALCATLIPAGCLSASAYIDPSVMTFGIQALVGIIIAAGAVLFVWWRKVKHKVSKTLHIDENAGKEVEEDIVVNDDVTPANNSNNSGNSVQASDEGSQDEQDHSAPEA